MGNKIFTVGLALSPLGLGFFLPIVVPAGAIILCVGAIAIVLDK